MNRQAERDRAWATLTEAARLHQDGKPELAEPLYREVLKSAPAHAQTWHLLGVARRQQGDSAEAASLIVRAIGLDPRQAEFHHNHGNALTDLGQLDKAEAAFRRALAINPDLGPSLAALAGVLLRKKDYVQAVAFAELAIRKNQKDPEGWLVGGKAALELKQYEGAAAMLINAVGLAPRDPEVLISYGAALFGQNKREEAEQYFRRATELAPDHVDAWINLGMARRNQPDGVPCYERAISLAPESALAHANLAQTLLLQGDYRRGFAEFEWRLRDDKIPQRGLTTPRWDGTPLTADQTLLIHCEQGFGDAILFVGFLPKLKARLGAGRLALECPTELARLFAACLSDVDAVVARTDAPAPEHDVHFPLMSAPLLLGETVETIGRDDPYLFADPAAVAAWGARMAGLPQGVLKVGLAWAGNPRHLNDAQRSTSLAALAPLFAADKVAFVSLQHGLAAAQTANPPAGAPLMAVGQATRDFADLAAVVAQLDLVVTVDTAVAHLSAALGKPTWVLLPRDPDWRWLLGGESWPWRPTVRLFRQSPDEADLSGAVARAAAALAAL